MNKAALITGGAKRIGKSVALDLAEKGYDIAIHYNSSEKEAIETKSEVEKKGVSCKIFSCNLENTGESIELFYQVFESFPGLNLLVNNASIFDNIDFFEVTPEYFDKDFAINFKSPFFISQAFARSTEKGHIINFLDTRVNRTAVQHFVYNLSKKCLYHFTRMAAKRLAPEIRVNGICPGPILPPPGESENYLDKIIDMVPMKKTGNTDNILSAMNYLLENDYITGECLFVDGGKHLNY